MASGSTVARRFIATTAGLRRLLAEPWADPKRNDQLPILEVEQWAIGGGFYVRATLPDGTVERIEAFATEGDAGRWIKNESVVWLDQRRKSIAS
jgi:hypothetical protein